jgi:hypothetical protein
MLRISAFRVMQPRRFVNEAFLSGIFKLKKKRLGFIVKLEKLNKTVVVVPKTGTGT